MSQENVALLYRAFDAFNRRDFNALLALMDDDVEAVSRLGSIEGDYHGHDGIRRWWQNWLDAFPDYTPEVVDVRDLGDLMVAALRVRGHGAGSDTPVEETQWLVSKWRDNKVVRWSSHVTEADALKAVGLPE